MNCNIHVLFAYQMNWFIINPIRYAATYFESPSTAHELCRTAFDEIVPVFRAKTKISLNFAHYVT
jgi:hypothetical protein